MPNPYTPGADAQPSPEDAPPPAPSPPPLAEIYEQLGRREYLAAQIQAEMALLRAEIAKRVTGASTPT